MSDFEHYSRPEAFEKATSLLLRARPELATALGNHGGDANLSVLSSGAQLVYERALLDACGLVDETQPDPAAERDRRMLQAWLKHELFRIRVEREHATNPIVHVELAALGLEELVYKPFAPAAERADAACSRLAALPEFFDTAREVLDGAPRVHVEKALELATGLARWLQGLPGLFAQQMEGPSEPLGASAEQAEEAVRGFAFHLEQVVLPRAPEAFALGEKLFLEKLRLKELIATDVDSLLRLHDEEAQRLGARLEVVLGRLGEADPAAAFGRLGEDRFEAASLLEAAGAASERLLAFVRERDLLSLPEQESCRVQEMPPSMWGQAALSPAGALEQAEVPALYYVCPVRDEWPAERKLEHLQSLNRWTLDVVTAHEVYPGHHVQLSHLRRSPRLVRRMLESTACVEGWAHYSEELLVEEGFAGGDARLELAVLQEALVRLARLRVALGLHVEGWGFSQAQALFQQEAHLRPSWAREEARRGAFDPTCLVYTLGKVMLRRLREKARRAWGERFSTKAFHDAVLAQGAPPLPLLEQALLA